MGYYETLIEMIEQSRKTLQEIADKCASDYNVKINRSYISKLQTRKQAPASDEVNIALAKVCGGDVDRFRYEGYIEKAPDFMKENIRILINAHKNLLFSNIKNNFSELDEETLERIQASINNLSDYEIFKFEGNYEKNSPNLEAELYSMKKIEKGGKEELQFNPLYGVIMNDESMEPRIPKGASLYLVSPDKINHGDIVLIKIESNDYLIRRYLPLEGNFLFLSENLAYEPLVLKSDAFEIVGKVKSMRINI